MVKVCTRCQKTHSGPQSFLLTCFGCEKVWHHRCHQPPVPDSELVARIKAFTEGDIENGLDGWTCRRCVKKRGKEREVPSNQMMDGKPADLQKPLTTKATESSEGKGSIQPEYSDPHGVSRVGSTLPLSQLAPDPSKPLGLSFDDDVKPIGVPGTQTPPSVQKSAHISGGLDIQSHHLNSTLSRKPPRSFDLALNPPAPTSLMTEKGISRNMRHPSTPLPRVTQSPSGPSVKGFHDDAGSISTPSDNLDFSMKTDHEEENAPSSCLTVTIKPDISIRTGSENPRSPTLSDSYRSTSRDVLYNNEIQTTPIHGTPPSADMDVDDDDFYWDPPVDRVRQPPQTPEGLDVALEASVPAPEESLPTPTFVSPPKLKDSLVLAWLHDRHTDTGGDLWDRAIRRKRVFKDKSHPRRKPLPRELGNEGEYRMRDLLNFSVDDWVRGKMRSD